MRYKTSNREMLEHAHKLLHEILENQVHFKRELHKMANTVADVVASLDRANASLLANKDATDGLTAYVNDLKAQIKALLDQIGNAGTDQAAIDDALAKANALVDGIDADTVAENALKNTDAEPTA